MSPRNAEDLGLTGEGECYTASLAAALDRRSRHRGWTLVHGRPTLTRPPFVKFGHAWVECGELVFDAAKRVTLPRALYYAIGHIDEAECYRYEYEEACNMLRRFGHCGPWEGPYGCPPCNPNDD